MKTINFFSRFFCTLCASLSLLMLVGTSQQLHALDPQPSFAGMPDMAGPAMAPGQGMPGMPPLPEGVSEADFEAMVNEISKQLETMSPEEIEKLQKEAEEMLINSGVSKEEIEAFKQGPVGYPEQPGQQPIAAPAEPFAPQPAMAVTPMPIEMKAAPEAGLSLVTESEVSQILKSIIRQAGALREQIALSDALRNLRPWISSLSDILFYVKVIDSKQELRKRLTTKEFSPLLGQLKRLSNTLEAQEYNLRGKAEELIVEENPYDMLRISPEASNKEIKQAAQELLAEKDPEKLKERLTQEGATALDIKRQVQSARIARAQIKEAYDKLTPAENRAQTDRRLKGQRDQQSTSEKALRTASTELNQIFSQVNTSVIHASEEFLKKYEPAELARKKEMDAAEAKQRKEQEARAQQKAAPAPYLAPDFYPPSFEGPKPFDAGRAAPFMPSAGSSRDTGSSDLRSAEQPKAKAGSQEAKGKKADDKAKGDADKGKEKDKGGDKGKGDDKEKSKKPKEPNWTLSLTKFETALNEFEKEFGVENIVALTKKINAFIRTDDQQAKKKLYDEILSSMQGNEERANRLKNISDLYAELEQLEAYEKISPENKQKLLERYTKIKKEHPATINLLLALAATQEDPKKRALLNKPAEAQNEGEARAPREDRRKRRQAAPRAPEEAAQAEVAEQEHDELDQKPKSAEDRAEEEQAAEQQIEQYQEEVDTFIAELGNKYPEDDAAVKVLDDRAEELIARIPAEHKAERTSTFERMQPALKKMHDRFEQLNGLIGRWDDLIRRARHNPKDATLEADAQALQQETEKEGYPDIAEAKYDEVFPTTWGQLKGYAKPALRWFADLLENSTDTQRAL